MSSRGIQIPRYDSDMHGERRRVFNLRCSLVDLGNIIYGTLEKRFLAEVLDDMEANWK